MENTVYYYTVFGLRIESGIYLPELRSTTGNSADIRIHYGEVPKRLKEPLDEGYFFQAAKDEFLPLIENVAAFYISGGREIVVEPYRQDDFERGRLYLLGTSLGVLLMQRGMAPMHGSTVVMDGQGVMLTGVSGAGKSTLASALRIRGCSLVTDDVSAVQRDEKGVFWVLPGYPQQKLDEVSAEMTGVDTRGLKRIFDRNKFAVPVREGFHTEPVRLAAVYEIVPASGEVVSIEPLQGMERVAVMIANTYRIEFVHGLGLKLPHFQQCAAMAKQAPVFRLTRPADGASTELQAEAVVRHFKSL